MTDLKLLALPNPSWLSGHVRLLSTPGRYSSNQSGEGLNSLTSKVIPRLRPIWSSFGGPLRIEDLMRDGRYRMSLVLKRIEPDKQFEAITPEVD